MADLFVDAHDGIRLSVRDHGGDGLPLVLLHGAGSHLASVGYLARQLRDFRVVSMDQRWSGLSGDSHQYDWGDLVRDVEAVGRALELDNPAVVGHSWGGMIAGHYGRAHPEAPAVVNLDGHGVVPDTSLFDGLTAQEAAAALAELDEAADYQRTSAGATGDEAWYRREREAATAPLVAMGMKPELVDEFMARSFADLGGGIFAARPAATLYDGVFGDLGLFDLYRHVSCRLLVLDASRPPPTQGQPRRDAHMAAYRRGLTKALAALDAEVGNLTVIHLREVDHQSIVGRDAAQVAEIVRQFVASAPAPP